MDKKATCKECANRHRESVNGKTKWYCGFSWTKTNDGKGKCGDFKPKKGVAK